MSDSILSHRDIKPNDPRFQLRIMEEVNKVKNGYLGQIAALQKQSEHLMLENTHQTRGADLDKEKIKQDLMLQMDKDGILINKLRGDNLKFENQFPLIKEAISIVREMMNGLVPEDTYLRLRNMPERDQNPNEWVQTHCWEIQAPYSRENKALKLENSALREDVKLSNEKHKQLQTEQEHYQRLLGEKDDDYKRFGMNYDNQKKGLEQEMKKLYDEIREQRGEAMHHDDLKKKHKCLQDEKEIVENKLRLVTPFEGDSQVPSRFDTNPDLRRKIDLLNADKEYLTRENIKQSEVNKRQDDRGMNQEEELNASKKQTQVYLESLLDSKNNSSILFEKRMNDELSSIREKHARETEIVKNNLNEIYEKQIRFLKEQKEDSDIKSDSLTTQLREKQAQYEELLREGKNWQNKTESDQGELRINYRIKVEEVERIRLELEELRDEHKQLKNENEMLKDKISQLRSEFFKAESKSAQESADLKATLAVSKEQLKNYEGIEKEVDEAIMGIDINAVEGDNVYLNTIQYAPTSTRRRVQQALNLAQRLQKKQEEVNKLNQNLELERKRYIDVSEELNMIKDLLDKTKQPSAYLIDNIEEKEKQLIEMKKTVMNLQNEKNYLHQNYSDLQSVFFFVNKNRGIRNVRSSLETRCRNVIIFRISKM